METKEWFGGRRAALGGQIEFGESYVGHDKARMGLGVGMVRNFVHRR